MQWPKSSQKAASQTRLGPGGAQKHLLANEVLTQDRTSSPIGTSTRLVGDSLLPIWV